MRIEKVEAVAVSVPLTRPYHIARGIMHAFPSVIVRITTDEEVVGYGESVPLSVVGDVGPIAARINIVGAEVLRNRSPLISRMRCPVCCVPSDMTSTFSGASISPSGT